jgi:hypothetical protein
MVAHNFMRIMFFILDGDQTQVFQGCSLNVWHAKNPIKNKNLAEKGKMATPSLKML